ncbi:hypothetical protein [Mesobacillus zeae]|uniref:hypothetical protein n=1 Tax=Mesobacillus zeae TaxID=1917180 RepID=UPI00300940DD
MSATIRIKYNSPAGEVLQAGKFQLKGRLPEEVAAEWIRKIRRDVYYEGLIRVIYDGDQDITDKVKALIE